MYRKDVRCKLFTAIIVFSSLFANGEEPISGPWKFGVATVNITPSSPMLMSGYASRETPATGKLTDLWAKVLVLEDAAGNRCALITADLIGISAASTARVKKQLAAKHDFDPASVSICCSHTHTGPALAGTLAPMNWYWAPPPQRREIQNYTQSLEAKIISVVGVAVSKLQAGSVSLGQWPSNLRYEPT